MLGLYQNEVFKIGTYVEFPNNVTTLLLLRKDGWYEDVVKNVLVGSNDIFKCSIQNLIDLVSIKEKYITKKTAIKYFNSLNKEQKNEEINIL